ncbi:MAG TPA: hypothetical protein VME43_17490 [Bryobacteraceae bacterium]|nr:hypothetical protein [Bryobacteraceae bacterium]
MALAVSSTPLLNRQQPISQPRRRGRAISLLLGLAGGLAGFFAPALASPASLAAWLIGFLAALSAGVLLHELGHLAAGILADFEFHQILAGPWMVTKEMVTGESSGYQVRFLPRRILTFAGHTQMIPRTTENLRRGFAIFAAGGPVATALLFLPVLLVPWGPAAFCLLAANLVLAAFSWIPMTIAGFHTDGKILLTLAGTGPSSESFAAVLYVMAIDQRGVEPHQWPPEIVDRLQSETAGGWRAREFRGEAALLLAIRALDGGETTAMAAALEQVLGNAARLRPDQRRICFAEAAFFQGVHQRNAALALDWLQDARQVKGGVTLKDWDAAAQAAVAISEENWDQARAQIARAIARLDRQPGRHGSVVAWRRRLVALRDSLPAGASTAVRYPGT